MLKTTALAIAASILATAAIAQTALPDPVTIKVSRQALQIIGQGLGELPLKTSAPILNDLQAQLNAADNAAIEAQKPKVEVVPGGGGGRPPGEEAAKAPKKDGK